MGLHKTEENLQVAMKENSVITFEEDYEVRYEGFNPNNVESYIMISLMQDTYLEQSLSAASLIQDQFRERAVRKDRGVKQAGFLVLWQTSMPSILIETGFLSNPNEENYLASEQGQDHLASAVFRAFRDYKQDIESRSATLTVFENHPDSTGSAPAKPQSEEGSVISKGENIYYKVQISASSTSIPLNAADFNGFGDVEEFRQNNIYKYAVGSKKNYDEILEFSKQVKTNYPDAFIIAVKNGKIIPVTEAIKQGNPN
jgi:N-acetylmuramoyl-L-alanine amidase